MQEWLRSGLAQPSQQEDQGLGKSLSVWFRLTTAAVIAIAVSAPLVAIPGYFSHDELGWIDMIRTGHQGWSFGLGSLTHSSFFRLLGTIVISASLRLPLEPFGAHAVEVVIALASAALLYRSVYLFRPDRALAASLLFLLMPGYAFDVGWVAAGFDVQFTFWGLLSVYGGILYWRGRSPGWGALSAAAFAAALCCKETAISIPICAALVMWADRERLISARALRLVAIIAAVAVIYLALGAHRILHTSGSGSGGYVFGGITGMLRHAVPYFGFPFARSLPEITNFPPGREGILFCVAHLVLVVVIAIRGGWKWALVYLVAFFATLLPVLPISKVETQYGYAPSIAIAVAIALVWSRRPWVALPIAILTIDLAMHSVFLVGTMYQTGACQARALSTIETSLMSMATPATPSVLVNGYQPWWILQRATFATPIWIRAKPYLATVTQDPAQANMTFSADCGVSLIRR